MITRDQDTENEQRERMRGGTGTVTLNHWFQPAAFGARVRLCARMTLEPGASIGPHTHEGEDELYLILAGEGALEENGVWKPVRAGDAILTGRGASHAVRNEGDVPLVIAAIILLY